MHRLFVAVFGVVIAGTLMVTATAQGQSDHATERWQSQLQDQPIRAAVSVQDEFATDQISISLEFSSVHQTLDGLISTLRRRRTDIITQTEEAGMHVAEVTIVRMELRQRNSDSDDFKYFGNVAVRLTVAGLADPLEVASRLNRLPARSVGDLQYSLSKTALKDAEGNLRNRALKQARREASSEARLRNTHLGELIRFSFETHVNRKPTSTQNAVVISGRGLAVFKPQARR